MSYFKSSFLLILLFLRVVKCNNGKYTYYDDATWVEDEETIAEDDEIVYDEGVYEMLVSAGYLPESPKYTKHLVSISTNRPTQFFGDNHYCTGTLIGAQLVATAAHCFVDFESRVARARRILVTLGTPNRLRHTALTVTAGVSELKVHPDFYREKKHDMALLFLQNVILYDTPTIEILSFVESKPKVGKLCTVVGWGRMLYMGPYASDALYIDLRILNDSICQDHYGDHYDPDSNICVGHQGGTEMAVCRGDSGSPLLCDDRLAGVAAYGFTCGENSKPNIFTDINAHKSWIYRLASSKEKTLDNRILYVIILGYFFLFN